MEVVQMIKKRKHAKEEEMRKGERPRKDTHRRSVTASLKTFTPAFAPTELLRA